MLPTLRRAFQDLVTDGWVRRIRGRGTYPVRAADRDMYVRPVGTIEDLMEWRDSRMELMQPISLESAPEDAKALDLPGKAVATLLLRRTFEGKPFALSRVCVPPDLGRRLVEEDALPSAGVGTIIGSIVPLLSAPVTRVQQEITAAAMSADVATTLDCEPGAPGLRVERSTSTRTSARSSSRSRSTTRTATRTDSRSGVASDEFVRPFP